jgi:hypothetical protein
VALNFIVTGTELLPFIERNVKRLYYKCKNKQTKINKPNKNLLVPQMERTIEE